MKRPPSDRIEEFLARPLNAVFASLGRNGHPVLAPVWFVWTDGQFVISTTTRTRRWRNLQRDNRCSLLVDDLEGTGYVGAAGRARLRTDDIEELTREVVGKYVEQGRVESYLRELEAGPPRSIIEVSPDRLYSFGL